MAAKRKSNKIGLVFGQFELLDTWHDKYTVRCVKCGEIQERSRWSITHCATDCLKCGKPMRHRNTTGHYGERIQHIYTTMLQRTTNPLKDGYHRYGGRGIKVCKEWQDDFQSFYNWAIRNGYADNLTIDRIDIDGDYCPENCRWVDAKTQQNNRSTNKRYTMNCVQKTAAQWADEYRIPRYIVYNRLRAGWTIEKTLTEPIDVRKRTRKKRGDT